VTPDGKRPVGIEVFYWLDSWSDDQTSCFDKARRAGFDGVEISLIADAMPDVDRYRRMLADHGLGIACSTGLTPSLDVSSPDREIRGAGVAHLVEALKVASALGSPVLGGVTYAPWLHFPDAAELGPFADRSAASLAEVARVAEGLGVVLCLELLNRFETFMLNTVQQGLRFLDLVDHRSVQLELDTFHMNIEEDDLGGAIRLAGDRLGHFQCAANNRRPPQYGRIDWDEVKAALDDVAYDGWVVFETFPNPAVEVGRTTYAWRELTADADDEARAAATLMRERLA
jgi:D-psicose/D-tagatose/L-ribulose 3-epimerase